jgi:hypothetical protein
LTGTIAQDTAGVTKTSDFVPQSQWNVSKAEWIDPTKINQFKISYQYAGVIDFFVENWKSGTMELVHQIHFVNKNTTPALGNPSLRCGAYVFNGKSDFSASNTTSLTCRATYFKAYTRGLDLESRNPRAQSVTGTVTTTQRSLIALRNRRTYNGIVNQVSIKPLSLSIANEANKNIRVEVRTTTNPDAGLLFVPTGTNLISDYSVTQAAFSGGRLLAAFTVGTLSSETVDLERLGITLPPSLNLIVTVVKNGGNATDVTAALTWLEET